jgi:hypothetical protein
MSNYGTSTSTGSSTLYLTHGLIFWSIGSAICVYLARRGIPYWLNLLTVAICCYATLFASLPLLSPVVETLGKQITSNIWQFAREKPAPRRPTLFPFPDDFFFVRRFGEQEDVQKGRLLTDDIVTPNPRGSFRRFVASVTTSADTQFTHHQSQVADLASTRAISCLIVLVDEPRLPAMSVGVPDACPNAEVLRRNNSSAKDKKSTRNDSSTRCAPRQ